jgi:hypothetical protein
MIWGYPSFLDKQPLITKWYLYSTNIGLGGISDLEPWLTSLATELVGRLREEIFEPPRSRVGYLPIQSIP